MQCRSLTTDLSAQEARLILEPYFFAAQEKFVEFGLRKVKSVRLTCDARMHDTARHFAGTETSGRVIKLAPELAEVDESLVTGIIWHEFGHATDFLYPGEFVLGRDSETVVQRELDRADERQRGRWLSMWQKRDDYVVEKTADLIAGLVWGSPIGYVGPCMLETFDGGVPRPVELR